MAGKKGKDAVNSISPFNDAKYQIEDDLRTLQRAKEIEADPKRLKAVRALAKSKLEEMEEIAGAEDNETDDTKGKK